MHYIPQRSTDIAFFGTYKYENRGETSINNICISFLINFIFYKTDVGMTEKEIILLKLNKINF